MLIFVYEFATGGGLLDRHATPALSLLGEGAAMASALAADFAALPDVEVVLLADPRWAQFHLPAAQVVNVRTPEEHDSAFDRMAARADWTVVIAPEFDGQLLDRCRRVQSAGGRLLGPAPAVVDLAGDKQATVEHLASAGVSVPAGCVLQSGSTVPEEFPFPAVLKPLDGAGSLGIRLVDSRRDVDRLLVDAGRTMRLEVHRRGIPASVAFLCGPDVRVPLPACRQHVSADGRFRYLGGSLPLPTALKQRATGLATRAINSLPSPLGYLGVDVILGTDPTGDGDAVIEINPRLTTSYIGLRAATDDNLAAAMFAAVGGTAVSLNFRREPLRFGTGGDVYYDRGANVLESTRAIESTP